MSNIAEEYEVGRCTVKIEYDEDAQSPRDDDNVGTMCCWHRHYRLGDEQPKEDAGEYLMNLARQVSRAFDKQADRFETLDRSGEAGPVWEKAKSKIAEAREDVLEKHYVILPLYLYDHGGITISTGPFSCKWDSGKVGFIYCSLEKALHEWGTKGQKGKGWDGEARYTLKPDGSKYTLREATIKFLEGEVENYDDFLTGQCFGYVVTAENGEEESCWGYIGDIDYVKSEANHVAEHLNKQMEEEDALAAKVELETALAVTMP